MRSSPSHFLRIFWVLLSTMFYFGSLLPPINWMFELQNGWFRLLLMFFCILRASLSVELESCLWWIRMRNSTKMVVNDYGRKNSLSFLKPSLCYPFCVFISIVSQDSRHRKDSNCRNEANRNKRAVVAETMNYRS